MTFSVSKTAKGVSPLLTNPNADKIILISLPAPLSQKLKCDAPRTPALSNLRAGWERHGWRITLKMKGITFHVEEESPSSKMGIYLWWIRIEPSFIPDSTQLRLRFIVPYHIICKGKTSTQISEWLPFFYYTKTVSNAPKSGVTAPNILPNRF